MRELYCNDDYIDWKDFIIWNLLIPYPTEFEILDTRQQFRNMDPDKLEFVNQQQFSAVNFWFEDEYKDEASILRMTMFKELLCRMFQTDSDKINYSALLLYFCKDEEALQGVIKALEVATGQLVCWDVTVGEKFIRILRQTKTIENQNKSEALTAAQMVVEEIYKQTVEQCISTFSFLDVSGESLEAEDLSPRNSILEEEIGEEEICDFKIPSLCYFLKWSVLVKVMTAALPKESVHNCIEGKSLLMKLKDIYCSLQNPEFENKVFMHEFLNNDEFAGLIYSTTKFVGLYPSEIVRNLIEVCTCEGGI